MKYNRNEKKQYASEIFNKIQECMDEDDLENISDTLDDFLISGRIFKNAYKFLSEELDCRLSYLIEKSLI